MLKINKWKLQKYIIIFTSKAEITFTLYKAKYSQEMQ